MLRISALVAVVAPVSKGGSKIKAALIHKQSERQFSVYEPNADDCKKGREAAEADKAALIACGAAPECDSAKNRRRDGKLR